MISNHIRCVLTLAAVTIFIFDAQAETAKPSQIENPKSQLSAETLGIQNLPLILDARTIQFDKIRAKKVESYDVEAGEGPGAGGGGGICAGNIIAGMAFITDNIDLVPSLTKFQRQSLTRKMNEAVYYQGANLKVRGQSVNAINYPSTNAIVLDGKACDTLESEGASGYSLLLHENLGLLKIDDTSRQISNAFAANIKDVTLKGRKSKVMCTGSGNEHLTIMFVTTESGYRVKRILFQRGSNRYGINKDQIIQNGEETDFSSPSRISYANSYGDLSVLTAPDRFATILEKKGSSMSVKVDTDGEVIPYFCVSK